MTLLVPIPGRNVWQIERVPNFPRGNYFFIPLATDAKLDNAHECHWFVPELDDALTLPEGWSFQ